LLTGKLLGLLKEIDPRVVRAAGLFNPDAAPSGGSFFSTPFEAAAQNLGITPLVTPVRSDADIDAAISAIGREPSGGLVMMPDSFMYIHRARLIERAARHRVVAIFPYPEAAVEGGLQMAPQITFEGSESSDAARAQILSEIERLETHNKRITGCRVAVIAPSHKHRHGNGFQVHIWLTIPPHENIVVNNTASDDARHEHAEVAIKDAFAAARRQVDALAA